jgi:hypothetical protein
VIRNPVGFLFEWIVAGAYAELSLEKFFIFAFRAITGQRRS